jgi:hypothetical protein
VPIYRQGPDQAGMISMVLVQTPCSVTYNDRNRRDSIKANFVMPKTILKYISAYLTRAFLWASPDHPSPPICQKYHISPHSTVYFIYFQNYRYAKHSEVNKL